MKPPKPVPCALPNRNQIDAARRRFQEVEPRDLFYRVATELVDLSIRKKTKLSVVEALAVLLQTWNKTYYRFRGGFSEHDFTELQRAVDTHWIEIKRFRRRLIESFSPVDEPRVGVLFTAFEQILGPVGAAKCLHLLAPRFFPLWDRAIAEKYRIWLKPGPNNGALYARFIGCVQKQYRMLRDEGVTYPDLLKAIDEYNYVTVTLKRE